MKRVVVWLRPSKRPFLRPQSNSRPRCPHKRLPDRKFRESRERAEVESGRAVSRESRVGGELKGADEESRADCWVRLEVAFLVHHAAKKCALNSRF